MPGNGNLDYSKLVVPSHIAIIMDGNGRWAKRCHLPCSSGHTKGAEVVGNIVEYAQTIGVSYLTLFAFSTENWNRSKTEVEFLMTLFRKKLNDAIRDKAKGVKVNIIGRKSRLSKDIIFLSEKLEKLSESNTKLTLNIAIDYGSREEIVNAAKKIVIDYADKKIKNVKNITEDVFDSYLYTSETPDVDMLVRTAGEKRISNFLLWQSSYAELVFSDTLWPDFSSRDLDNCIKEFNTRKRTFGRRN